MWAAISSCIYICNIFLCLLISINSLYISRVLIKYVEDRDPYTWKGVVLAAALFLSQLAISVCLHNFLYYNTLSGTRARSILNAVIYRKVIFRTYLAMKACLVIWIFCSKLYLLPLQFALNRLWHYRVPQELLQLSEKW